MTTTRGSHRHALLMLLLIGAFGPYLHKGAGIRTDHLILYGFALWALIVASIGARRWRLPSTLWVVLACLVGATGWTLLVSLLVHSASRTEIIAAAESYLQPATLIFGLPIVIACGPPDERRRLIPRAIVGICLLLAANTLVAVASLFFDTWPFVQLFVRESAYAGTSVWQNAATLGRFSGVFDQPMEAGVAYSAGLAGWVYWVGRQRRPGATHLLLLGALVLGGFLSVSKVFILGGLPLCVLYLIWTFKFTPTVIVRYFIATLIFLALFIPGAVWLLNRWSGARFFLRLFDADVISSQGLIALYSAGRFGAGRTTVGDLFTRTWADAPIQGFGFGAFTPLDNAYVQFFHQGGLVALLLYAGMLAAIGWHALRHRKVARDESRFLAVLLVLVLGAGIGAPALTLNRSSVVVWALIVLTICASATSRRSAARLASVQAG